MTDLEKHMLRKGITKYRLAKVSGVDWTVINRYQKGERGLKLKSILSLRKGIENITNEKISLDSLFKR